MTCRHEKGDPNCSSNRPYVVSMPKTPDSKNYTIEDVHRENNHLVIKAKYPNCADCSYEGTKIMVFLNVTEAEAIKWKEINPHFSDTIRDSNQAPSPDARFPASEGGWKDAIAYAESKNFIKSKDSKEGCPNCGSTKTKVRNFDRMWGEGDVHCSDCGRYIRAFDSG